MSATRVYVSGDRLAAQVDCILEPGLEDTTVSEVMAQGESLGLAPKLEAASVKSAILTAAARSHRIAGLVLATGKAPTKPVNGSIEWSRDFFTKHLVANPKTGQIDYRQRLDNSVVAAGDTLAKLVPPEPGTPGLDVYGKPIAPTKPISPKLRAGSGVSFDETTNTFTAAADGRVRHAKGVLAVDQTYAIAGSVGLKTGHINHPGAVDIAKDVHTDSIVEAGGTVHIAGAVEESVVIGGGDVLIGHGVIGGDKATIRAGGCIEAEFAERSVLDAGHDIRIRRELIHCTAHSHGMIVMPEGQIIGGTASGVFGIDVGQAGSHGDVRTMLVAGVDPALQQQITAHYAQIEQCREQIIQLNERIAPFKPKLKSLTTILKKKLEELLKELEKAEAQRAQCEEELGHLQEQSKELLKSRIHIRRRVYPDTHLCIGHAKYVVANEADGPLVARINDDNNLVLEPEIAHP
ncbi:MAG: DUF342 domain-containing protein [Candidatus Hydrogenedentes bacterium]|nr:DUF342 domain-containing protein [Candidatus Hydrogenedentota bacterium]